MTPLTLAKPVEALQAAMLALPQVQLDSSHTFHGGMYVRQVFIPAGHTVVGKRHKRFHLFMVMSGALMISHRGEKATLHRAPFMHLSEPGTKRALHALEDSLVLTVHASKAKTVKGAEAVMVEPDKSSPFGVGNVLKQKALAQ